MKRMWVVWIMLIATLPLVAGTGPVLKFDQTRLDLGKTDPGKKVEAVFHFVNAGDALLKIQAVKPG